jgi:Xaa-Pro aminopeptidase
MGIDARMITHEKAPLTSSKLNSHSSKLVFPSQNLVNLIWKDKLPKLKEPIFIQPIEFTGKLAFSAWQNFTFCLTTRPIGKDSASKLEELWAWIDSGDWFCGLRYSLLEFG